MPPHPWFRPSSSWRRTWTTRVDRARAGTYPQPGPGATPRRAAGYREGNATRPPLRCALSSSSQCAVELADVVNVEIGCLVCGEVAAGVVRRPTDDVSVVSLGESADPVEVASESGQADRQRRRFGGRRRVCILVVESGGGRA